MVIFPRGYLRVPKSDSYDGSVQACGISSTSEHARVRVLARRRLGKLHVVLQRPADEEQGHERCTPPDRRRRFFAGDNTAEELAEHLITRIHLMNLVLARQHLGLPPSPPFELPAKEDSEAESA